MRKFRPILLTALICTIVNCSSRGQTAAIPDWVIQDWEHRTQAEGIWIADNSKYQSEQEPFEAYGLQWKWGPGKKSLTGRLYCLKDRKDVRTAWIFTEFWDPEAKELKLLQIAPNGAVGQGKVWLDAERITKSVQTFIGPDGSSYVSGHRSERKGNASHVSSFDVQGDQWTPRRSYIWKNSGIISKEIPTPEEFKPFEFLIGTWQVDVGDNRLVNMSFEWAQNKLMILYKSTNPARPGEPQNFEVRGMVAYHGVKEQIVFMSAYLDRPPTLINEGHFEFPEEGVIERIFTVFYKEGSGIPWSNGEKAPKGGKPVNFKQIWTKVDENTFEGRFLWEKNGKWEPPYKIGEGDKETWKRVK